MLNTEPLCIETSDWVFERKWLSLKAGALTVQFTGPLASWELWVETERTVVPLLTFPSDSIEPHKSDSQGHMVGDRQD